MLRNTIKNYRKILRNKI